MDLVDSSDGEPQAPDAQQPQTSRRKFTPEEDLKLRSLVESLGTKSWEEIAKFIPDRSARQCRDRYKNYLLDSLITNPWTPEEDATVIEKFHQIGPKWVEIGKLLSGRSGNNVKNRWHKHLCKVDIGPRLTMEKAPQAPEEPGKKKVMSLFNEGDWGQIFEQGEQNPLGYGSSWSSGFSVGDPLF
jgi:hypothetical protein